MRKGGAPDATDGQPQSRNRGRALFVSGVLVILSLLMASGAGALYIRDALSTPLHPGDALFSIERGESLRGVARALKRRGIIDESYSMRIYARLMGLSSRIQAGQYRFGDGITQRGILEKIVSGDVVRYRIQFIEGWTFRQMRDALNANSELEHQTTDATDEAVMAALGFPDQHPEGQFFPDTYTFIAGDSDLDILARAHEAMERVLAELWQSRDPELPLKTPYEALILASIVEKETGLASERDTISGVFINRLERHMRLQTDPTVIYGLGDAFDGNIRRRHLAEDNPYNTYTRAGLPPTPIAMPGRDALLAAVRPGHTPYLYFVARGDGSHYFSGTLDEHNRAVQKYQLNGHSGG